MINSPPSKIHLHKKSKTLELVFANQSYRLPAELLRVLSPSAEVRGHGQAPKTLVYGKIHVGIQSIKPMGNYGIQIVFDDGHDSGIYAWDYLQDLGEHQEAHWQAYLTDLQAQHKSRDPDISVIQFPPP